MGDTMQLMKTFIVVAAIFGSIPQSASRSGTYEHSLTRKVVYFGETLSRDVDNPSETGGDEILQIDSSNYPWRAIGALALSRNSLRGCTAVLVGPNLALAPAHCVLFYNSIVGLQRVSKSFDMDFRDEYKRWEGGAKVRAKPISGGYPGTKVNGKEVFSVTDWYLLELDRPIGNELGWFGILNSDGLVLASNTGRRREFAAHEMDYCANMVNPLKRWRQFAARQGGTKWWSVKNTEGPCVCMAGFPFVYRNEIKHNFYLSHQHGLEHMVLDKLCVLRGMANGVLTHDCGTTRGGSGSPMFIYSDRFGPLIVAIATGEVGYLNLALGFNVAKDDGAQFNTAVASDRFFTAVVHQRTAIEGQRPTILHFRGGPVPGVHACEDIGN